MDNKITKKRINEHLEYDWFKYLLILIALVALTVFACKQINRSRDYEDFNIFVACYSYGNDDFENIVLTEMNTESYDKSKYGDSFLREVILDKTLLGSQEFSQLFQTKGLISSDALVLNKLHTSANAASFLALTDEVLALIIPDGKSVDDFTYIEREVNGERVRYGIDISSFSKLPFNIVKGSTDEEASEEDEKFYLVINPRSANIGSFGWRAKEQNLQALFCIKLFLQYYN